ncbi:MAG: DEAD/DEAH box helicase [Bacteroidia bacterium]|nr:DEAD/DEAH box helicase [Bacteroidia bacterium]
MTFDEFDLNPDLLDGLHSMRYDLATPIQEAAIPVIMQGKDIIACAQTGTGKTAAYLIPILERIMSLPTGHTRAIIVAPTRELAHQIDQNFQAIAYYTGVSSVAVYGGKDTKGWDHQKNAIENGVDVVIATPGRFHLHNTLGYMDLSKVEMVVLDEADKMLDMGFHGDILKIIENVPKERQTIMFSATMPKKIRKLAFEIQRDPVEINFNLAKPAAGIDQKAYCVFDEQKLPLLLHLIKEKDIDSMIIFASSKLKVDEIERTLVRKGINIKAMHSDKEQEERTETLQAFKSKQFPIIVGTDVLARGIDIDNLSHVLNFDCPRDAEDYVHRVGRTARASKTGEAITFVSPKDFRRLSSIEELIESEIPKPEIPAFLGETPEYNPKAKYSGGDRPGGGGGRSGGGKPGGGRSGGGNRRGGKPSGGGGSRSNNPQGPRNSGGEGSGPGAGQSGNKRRNYKPNSKGPQGQGGGKPTA